MIGFSSFPTFEKFDLSKKDTYLSFYTKFNPYCDFSFVDLYVWLDINDSLEISSYGENVIFRFDNPFESFTKQYTFIGNDNCRDVVDHIFRFQKDTASKQRIVMVPEVAIKNIGTNTQALDIKEEIDNKDYIFKVTTAYQMAGKNYADFRHKINYFMRNYSAGLEVRSIDLANQTLQKTLLQCLDTWYPERHTTDNDKDRIEKQAIERFLRLAGEVDVRALGIFSKDQLIAFSLFHFPPQTNYAIGNHIKFNFKYRYIFDYTFYETLHFLYENDIEYINGEQDLGIPGLRIHKQEMQPYAFLRRFGITPLP